MSINPYAAPSGEASSAPPLSEPEAIRRKYLSHEASVKSIGTLYLLGAIFLVPIGLFLGISGIAGRGGPPQGLHGILIGAFYVAIGILQGATAVGLRRLQPWSRIVGIIFSLIGLFGFPIGTLISAYFLYLLASKKGSYVFSEEYRRIVAETPHIKYRTSIVVIILLIILIVLIVGGLAALVIGAAR